VVYHADMGCEAMRLTAHQPAYLPWLGLFDKISQAEAHVVFDVCPQESSGFENRNKILGTIGEQWLTVPVRRGRHTPLSEVEIVRDNSWQRKHWRSIEYAYQHAPYWTRYAEGLKFFYDVKWEKLIDLTDDMLRWFMEQLGLAQPVTRASTLQGLNGAKSDLVLSMCKAMGATEYIFGAMGKSYADVAAFEAAGIKVRFQEYHHPMYPQLHRGFVPNLSIVDLLMNVGPDSLKVLRNDPAQ
jgi:hypothetical protein